MKNMPKMVEEYRAKMRAMRQDIREKKEADEAKRYSIAIGKTSDVPEWVRQAQEQKKKKGWKTK